MRDERGFLIAGEYPDTILTGETSIIRLLDLTATVGTAEFSTSGQALNMVSDQQLHMEPLLSLRPVLNGNHRERAPLFVPKDDVAPDARG